MSEGPVHGAPSGEERTRVAAYAVARDDRGRVLLCHLSAAVGLGDLWVLPGGGIEFGEPPDRAVLRELGEETGLSGRVTGLLDVGDRVLDGRDGARRLHSIGIVYAVDVTGGALRDELDGSTDACRWFTLAETTGLALSESARRALAELEDTA